MTSPIASALFPFFLAFWILLTALGFLISQGFEKINSAVERIEALLKKPEDSPK